MSKFITTKNIFILIAFMTFGFAIYFSFYKANEAMTGIWLVVTLFCGLFAFPNIIESISFGENYIKFQKIDATISELEKINKLYIPMLLEMIQTQGRWCGIEEEVKIEFLNNTTTLLEHLGFSKDKINAMQSKWHYFVEVDYINEITYVANTKIDVNAQKEMLSNNASIINIEFFKNNNLYTEDTESLIKCFLHYKENRVHLDLNRWKKLRNR